MIVRIVRHAESHQLFYQHRVWRVRIEDPKNVVAAVAYIAHIHDYISRQVTLDSKEPAVRDWIPETRIKNHRGKQSAIRNRGGGDGIWNRREVPAGAIGVSESVEHNRVVVLFKRRVPARVTEQVAEHAVMENA